MNTRTLALSFTMALALAGCATPPATDLASVTTNRSALVHEQPLVTVRLDESFWLKSRTDYKTPGILPGVGEPLVGYTTAAIWRTMFTGGHEAASVLILDEQHFTRTTNAGAWLVPGISSAITYHVSVTLEHNGQRHTLEAEGKSSAQVDWDEASRIAVDAAIADIARQVRTRLL